jgi:cytidylate kinase
MPVIAMTQEMGSLAKDVAHLLAESLGLEVMEHEVAEHLSSRMSMSKSAIRRVREGKAGLLERISVDERSLAVYTAQEVLGLADKGNIVLRGWGATCLLRPVSHVVSVRITRSLKNRIEWVANNLETDDLEFAESEIRRSDEAHAARMHQQFGVTWGDPLLYDLVLNTDRVAVESAVEQIRTLVGRPEFQETAASRLKLANMTLEAQVRAALKDHPSTSDLRILIEANDGLVKLGGIVLRAEERTEAEQVASDVAGVKGVDSQLRLMVNSKRFTSAKY